MRETTDHEDVQAFFTKFGIPRLVKPGLLDDTTLVFRLKRLTEELDEFAEAHGADDLEGAADALIDLAYIVHGTAICMGLPWDALWVEVQRANMEKVRAQRPEESKHGTTLDIIKPPFWRAPDHKPSLRLESL
jgi:predicted HAD superfamily Cof-like phosphohydrolase